MKPKARWPDAHVNLKRLYDERADGMSLQEFGSKYDIGTKGMVWQYLTGRSPLNYESAAKFARGLRCSIYDISPGMADAIKDELLPFLGKALRRAAMLAAFAVLPALTPSPADARTVVPERPSNCVLCQLLRRIMLALGLGLLAACTTIDEHTAPPADWPRLTIHEHRVAHSEMRDRCMRFTSWFSSPEACAIIRFDLLRCDIYFSRDFPPPQSFVAHEYQHCAGYQHHGDTTLSDAWRQYKATTAGEAIAKSVR